jgi:hypothetical protein
VQPRDEDVRATTAPLLTLIMPGVWSGRGKREAAEMVVGLTVQRLTRAARAYVATAERHAACQHLKRAMQAA